MPDRKAKHRCRDHWEWETVKGIRIFREVGRERLYNVKCAVCKRESRVTARGIETLVVHNPVLIPADPCSCRRCRRRRKKKRS
jgi:hypothetical protein